MSKDKTTDLLAKKKPQPRARRQLAAAASTRGERTSAKEPVREFQSVNHILARRGGQNGLRWQTLPALNRGKHYLTIEVEEEFSEQDLLLAVETALNTLSARRGGSDTDAAGQKSVIPRNRSREAGNQQIKSSVLENSHWLKSEQLADIVGSTAKNRNALPNRWKKAGKIFAVSHEGHDLYPEYAVDHTGTLLPVIQQVLDIFGSKKTAWATAVWFDERNSWLDNHAPRELVATKPENIILAARKESEGATHG
ncbi:hypothetical protein [Erwinia mallotivora]|uniref:hypothetical protein n=1 Tax=Erwinia mallotivora TaxID=69222 RepID=UPI0021C193DD|nr:hypothetical protein [Erwinia mallotivora]